MIKKVIIFSVAFSFLLIKVLSSNNYEDKIIEYNVDNQNVILVVVADGDLSQKKAKDLSMRRAAEIALERSYKYFKINAEERVMIQRGKEEWPSPYDFPQNLYEERIIEKGYNRERFYHDRKGMQDSEPKEGYRFEIQFVNESSDSFDACDYAKCK